MSAQTAFMFGVTLGMVIIQAGAALYLHSGDWAGAAALTAFGGGFLSCMSLSVE